MSSLSCIEQSGIIEEITQGSVVVRFTQHAACGSCNAKMLCGMTESNDDKVNVPVYSNDFSVGEHVKLQMVRSLGLKAVFLAYVLPIFLILAFLLVLNSLGLNELISGIISLGILLPYFLILSFKKHLLKKTFTFSISKLTSE